MEKIQAFLEGHNPKKYVVAVEANNSSNKAVMIIHDSEKNKKYSEIMSYRPFLFMKDLKGIVSLYKDNVEKKKSMMNRFKISIKKLETKGHERLEGGFKYLVSTEGSFNDITSFFRFGGINIYKNRELFVTFKAEEQFLISTGIRLFKGFKNYKDLHKMVFDIETTGLDPEKSRIFLIGVKDNKTFQKVIAPEKMDDDASEKEMIIEFFKTINLIKPAIISGYNSENFDFTFILKRAEILGLEPLDYIETALNNFSDTQLNTLGVDELIPFTRKDATLKLGSETEQYKQTVMYGYNIIDIIHAVRRAQAINSDIKKVGLKYICKYAEIATPNRMYVDGEKIYKIWEENKNYYINKSNNNYKVIPEQFQDNPKEYIEKLKVAFETKDEIKTFFENVENISYINGREIITQYLIDDLWETEQVDEKFNQASFLFANMLPTSYGRASTMGNASVWNLIMGTWSYENNLAIPKQIPKRDFTGGVSRVFRIGFAKKIKKTDFAGLYPSIMLQHNVFPSCDVTDILKQLLSYFRDTRNLYKKLAGDETLSQEERTYYDIKQLPIKILNNSMFGALGSGIVFYWSDMDCAERITCTGRQYLRRMVKFFINYDCIALIIDTDGLNLSAPEYVNFDINLNKLDEKILFDDLTYVDKEGKEHKGIKAIIKKFNTEELKGFVQVDFDGEWVSTINFSRKNYANLTTETIDKKTGKKKPAKIKKTGNSIKSKKIQTYLEEFIDNGLKLLLYGKSKEFVDSYYDYIEKLYTYQIPLSKLVNKAKVKTTIDSYINRGNTIKGVQKASQAFMELLIKEGITPNLGDVIYYINIGTKKGDGDAVKKKLKDGTSQLILNSTLVSEKDIENDTVNTEIRYNVPRYIAAFNKKVEPLLCVFKEDVRNRILVDNPSKKQYFTESELELINYDLDTLDELFTMEDKEVDFWNRTGLNPKDIFENFKTNKELIIQELSYDHVMTKLKPILLIKGINIKDNKGTLIPNDIYLDFSDGKYLIKKFKESESEVIQEINLEKLK
jgi:DNA polymerase elongation subunit (family B)